MKTGSTEEKRGERLNINTKAQKRECVGVWVDGVEGRIENVLRR